MLVCISIQYYCHTSIKQGYYYYYYYYIRRRKEKPSGEHVKSFFMLSCLFKIAFVKRDGFVNVESVFRVSF